MELKKIIDEIKVLTIEEKEKLFNIVKEIDIFDSIKNMADLKKLKALSNLKQLKEFKKYDIEKSDEFKPLREYIAKKVGDFLLTKIFSM